MIPPVEIWILLKTLKILDKDVISVYKEVTAIAEKADISIKA